jgi:hypothetical protein
LGLSLPWAFNRVTSATIAGLCRLARIPLGPCPSLHQLRRGSLRFVHRLPSYYGRVRLLGSVHHRLRLLTFPMRAGSGYAVPVRPEISQLPMRSFCT